MAKTRPTASFPFYLRSAVWINLCN